MRFSPALGSLVLAFASASALPAETASERLLKDANTQLQKGEHELEREKRFVTPAGRLAVLEQAIRYLRQAETKAWKGTGDEFGDVRAFVRRDLVLAYDRQGALQFERRSLAKAKNSANAALDLDASDAWALNLVAMIEDAESTDIYAKNQGTAAVNRIRDRRAATGMPLRDRGVALRR